MKPLKYKSHHDVTLTGTDTIVAVFEAIIDEGEANILVSQMCKLFCFYLIIRIQYNPASNNDNEGSDDGAYVSGITDEDKDDVVRVLPANLILYH